MRLGRKKHRLGKFVKNGELSCIIETTKHNRESEVKTNEGRSEKMDWVLYHKNRTEFCWEKSYFWIIRSEDSRGVEGSGAKRRAQAQEVDGKPSRWRVSQVCVTWKGVNPLWNVWFEEGTWLEGKRRFMDN